MENEKKSHFEEKRIQDKFNFNACIILTLIIIIIYFIKQANET
jgi:hypothetical protein